MEKIYKRTDGSKVKVNLKIGSSYTANHHWILDVTVCPAGKKKFAKAYDPNDWSFRSMDMNERSKFVMDKFKELISDSELSECMEIELDTLRKSTIDPVYY